MLPHPTTACAVRELQRLELLAEAERYRLAAAAHAEPDASITRKRFGSWRPLGRLVALGWPLRRLPRPAPEA